MAPLAITTTQKPLVQGTNPNGPKSKKNKRKAAKQSKKEEIKTEPQGTKEEKKVIPPRADLPLQSKNEKKKTEPQDKKEEKKVLPPRTKLPFIDSSVPGTGRTTLAKKTISPKTTTPPKTDKVPAGDKPSVPETQILLPWTKLLFADSSVPGTGKTTQTIKTTPPNTTPPEATTQKTTPSKTTPPKTDKAPAGDEPSVPETQVIPPRTKLPFRSKNNNKKKTKPQNAKEEKKVTPPRTKLPFIDSSVPGTRKTTQAEKNTPPRTDKVPAGDKHSVWETRAKQSAKNTTPWGVFRVPRHTYVPEITGNVVFLPEGGFLYPIVEPGSKVEAFELPASSPVNQKVETKEAAQDTNCHLPRYPGIKPGKNV